jgi:hypothetical protein
LTGLAGGIKGGVVPGAGQKGAEGISREMVRFGKSYEERS